MAEEVVVKDQLTNEMVAAGRELTEQLAIRDSTLVSALWLYDPESNQWRFVVASPRVDTEGPLKVYEIVEQTLHEKGIKLPLKNVSAWSPTNPIIVALKSTLRVGGPADVRFTRNRVNDVYIDDSYILFLK